MKITLLGTGSPEAYARRASSGCLVEIGADRILLDCGGGVVDRMLQSGRRPSGITHIFFSHLHSDHMMDYARLVHAAWDEGGAPIRVFGPSPIGEITQRLFGPEGAFAFDLRARTELGPSKAVWLARGGALPRPWPAPEVTEVAPGFDFACHDWRLTSCEVPHAQPLLDCMAFRIESGGRVFVYSGDAAICPELAELAGGADLLLHWCYRLTSDESHPALIPRTPTPPDIAAMAEAAGAKQLVLTHFRMHMDSAEAHREVAQELAKDFSGASRIAEDLDEFVL